jgi:hypothetical protein
MTTSTRQHGDITLIVDLFAYCPHCDPKMAEGMVLNGFDEVGAFRCEGCKKPMTSYGINAFEVLAHGTSCESCVAACERPTRDGERALTSAEFEAIKDFAQLRELGRKLLDGEPA